MASANASTVVNVVTLNSLNTTNFLSSSLKTNIAVGNVNGILQSINLASSIVSSKNCSAAPNCSALNRHDCLGAINTCADCLNGYKGVMGDSNTRCLEASTATGATGSKCKLDSDCLYHQCDSGICIAPQKICQSSVPGAVCSGHGSCRYLDPSGTSVQNCSVVDQQCSATCLCRVGYGGGDCSLNSAALEERSNLRVGMCTGLQHVIAKSRRSPQLFDTIASALLVAYDHTEISGTSQLVQCSSVVRFLGTLASKGFLKGTLPATQQIYAEISSQFVGTRVSASSKNSSKFANDVSNAVKGMTEGIIKGMLEGQSPVNLVTNNIRATLVNELASKLANATFSSPATDAEMNYGSVQPKINIVGNGINVCASGANYAQLSTLQYGTNPHSDSDSIKSPLFQFSSTKKVLKVAKVKTNGSIRPNGIISNYMTSPAYYVILQFSSKQKFDLSIPASSQSNTNYSIPACSLYNPSLAKYVSCGNCNISSYTNFNVTFGCYDIRHLCPPSASLRRGLGNTRYEIDGNDGSTISNDIDQNEENIEDEEDYNEDEEDDNESSLFSSSRELAADNDTVSTDDGPAQSDDRFDSKRSESVSEFGTVLNAVFTQLSDVLSTNPFATNFRAATAVLAFVGSLCGIFIIGLFYFLRWDKSERHDAVYLFDAREKEIKARIAEDLKKGGNGVTFCRNSRSKSYNSQTFMEAFHLSMRSLTHGGHMNRKNSSWTQAKTYQTSDDGSSTPDSDLRSGTFESNVLIAEFSNKVLPKSYTPYEGSLKYRRGRYKFKSTAWTDAFYTLRRTHYLTAMFYRASLCVSRTLRYLDMCRKVLLYLFIDTVLYGVFFPSDSTCTSFLRRAECISIPSKVWIKVDNNFIHQIFVGVRSSSLQVTKFFIY